MAGGGEGEAGGLVFARFAEMRFGVPVTFENVYDLEAPFDIAKEYHIASVGKAADIPVQLRGARPSVASSAARSWHFARSLRTKVSATPTLPLWLAM